MHTETAFAPAAYESTPSALRPAARLSSLGRRLPTVARVLMGLCFFAFGLTGLLNLLPPPSEPMPEAALAFGGALAKTGYMFPLIKGTETVAGALLLSNRFVPLALAIIAPVVVNIVAFNAVLARSGSAFSVALLALEIYLAWAHRSAFRPMLAMRALPPLGRTPGPRSTPSGRRPGGAG